jgi:hypothetical protein
MPSRISGFAATSRPMLRIVEHAITPVEGEIPTRLCLVLVDEHGAKHEFFGPPLQFHRISDDLLRAVAKVMPRTGTG